ncbi:unnamed protein product, partial [Plutella xylostella]
MVLFWTLLCFGRHVKPWVPVAASAAVVKPSQRPSGGLKTSDSRVALLPDNFSALYSFKNGDTAS